MHLLNRHRRRCIPRGRLVIELSDVRKTFAGGVEALRGVTFQVAEGEICVLIGPSGCGKTTLLRLINKLLPLTSGSIRVAGRDIATEDAVHLRRRMGYVIQQVGLFPNMTVGENIAVVPTLLDWSRQRIRRRVGELLDLVGLPPSSYRERYPRELSGGEAQRVGVARALAADPPVMLMDEPFGALDPITRERLQTEFLGIQSQVRKTVLVVSHDMDEALRLGDRIVLLREGRVEQQGTPEAILLRPATPFVEQFIGSDRGFQQRARLPAIQALDTEREDSGPSTGDALTLPAETTVRAALAALVERSASHARLTDGQGRIVGRVSFRSLTRTLTGAHTEAGSTAQSAEYQGGTDPGASEPPATPWSGE